MERLEACAVEGWVVADEAGAEVSCGYNNKMKRNSFNYYYYHL